MKFERYKNRYFCMTIKRVNFSLDTKSYFSVWYQYKNHKLRHSVRILFISWEFGLKICFFDTITHKD